MSTPQLDQVESMYLTSVRAPVFSARSITRTPIRPANEQTTYPSQQILYEEFLSEFIDATVEVNKLTIEGLLESDTAIRCLKRRDAKIVLQLCYWAWQHSEPDGRELLSRLIASIRAAYPALPVPEWAVAIDPEAL